MKGDSVLKGMYLPLESAKIARNENADLVKVRNKVAHDCYGVPPYYRAQ